MTQIDLKIDLNSNTLTAQDAEILKKAVEAREEAGEFISQEKYLEAMERTVSALKTMREFTNYQNPEFRTLFIALLFDLAEIHYYLKSYKQSERELETLFKMLDNLVKVDGDRFEQYHILAMELSTRILRSRKKALDLLVKQQINTGNLYKKANSGVVAATDKLIDSLCSTAQLLAATGDIRESLKFYAEAIKCSKKRTGRVTLKEVKMTVDMAEVMLRQRALLPRAKRLLDTILPHAEALHAADQIQNINSLIEVIEASEEPETNWRVFLHKVIAGAKAKFKV